MPLAVGTRLGPYEVRSALGAGGMGEVYRARDTRLGREVALKVLPAAFAQDSERLRRFEQEARLAGSLNHPNLLTLFDVATHDGAPCLVTELLEGHSLRELLEEGPLAARKALAYAQQMARGLSAAHAKGIVHRDIKPGNVFVTDDGRVKILDFGLAKPSVAWSPETELSGASTQSVQGLAMGTVGYMAPEQVRGQACDARSDIFSFGAVLYEMLSGRRAFSGETTADTLTAILTKDPEELSRPGLAVPTSLERISLRCLEKDPAERFQSAKDVAFALEAGSGVSHPGIEPAAPVPARRRRLVPAAVGLAVIAAGALGLWAGRAVWERPLPKTTQLTYRRGMVDRARFTADGKTVVYSAFWDGQPPEIFTTRVESPESRSLGLPPARLMSVSSKDELAILLTPPGDQSDQTTGTLARVPLSGGEPRRVLDDVLMADWSPDGRELAVIRRVEGEFQLEYPVGKVLARPVAAATHPIASFSHLRVSPRGDRVAVLDALRVCAYDAAGNKVVFKTPATLYGLAWATDEALWVTAGDTFTDRSLCLVTPTGPARVIFKDLASVVVQDASRDGRLLIHHGFERVGVRAKAPESLPERELGVFSWSWVADLSADGRQVLASERDSPGRRSGALVTYVRPARGGPATRIAEGAPLALSSDGSWALVLSFDPRPRIELIPTGPGEPRGFVLDQFETIVAAWFLDDGHVVIDAATDGRRARSFLLDLSAGEPRPITPEAVVSIKGSYSSGTVLGVAPTGAIARYPTEGGDPQPVAARLRHGMVPLRASEGSRFVFVGRGGTPYRIERLEIASGRSTPWKVLRPDDLTGATQMFTPALAADGGAYAYTYGRYFQDLFLVEGLRP